MYGVVLIERNYSENFNNCLISNCGAYTAALTIGGYYGFNQCTFANYWPYSQRSTPSIYLNNYGQDNNGNPVGVALSKADFKNCIIYGNIENEFETDFVTSVAANYFFDHSILKVKGTTDLTDPLHYNVIYKNNDPDFKNTNDRVFELDTLAFATDKGDPALLLTDPVLQFDIKGVDRTLHTPPDLGAYERKD